MRAVTVLSFALAIVWALPASAGQSGQAAPAPAPPHVFSIGGVSVDIPPPKGFVDMLARSEEFRQRMGQNDRLIDLSAHMPQADAAAYQAGRDLPLYTKVSTPRGALTTDITDEFFASLSKQQSLSTLSDPELLKKLLNESAGRGGVSLDQSTMLGIVDQTPRSFSVLSLMRVAQGERRVAVLVSMTTLHLRRRLVLAYVYRVVQDDKDQALVVTLTKDWVRSVLAANEAR
jgi:hypothetical protein